MRWSGPDCRYAAPAAVARLVLEQAATQHVEDLPPTRTLVTRYEFHVGRCRVCGRRVWVPESRSLC